MPRLSTRLTHNEWRAAVFARDGKACRSCGSAGRSGKKATFVWLLATHHILPASRYPELARDVGNGIVLCGVCHEEATGRELVYAPKYLALIESNLNLEEINARHGVSTTARSLVRPNDEQSRALVEKLGWQDLAGEIESIEQLEEQAEGGSEGRVRVRFRKEPTRLFLAYAVLAAQLDAWFARALTDRALRSGETAAVLRRRVGPLKWKSYISTR